MKTTKQKNCLKSWKKTPKGRASQLRCKKRQQERARLALKDSYIRKQIAHYYGLRVCEVPEELIPLKRKELIVKRTLRKGQSNGKEKND
jgi:hypothetical protein